MLFKIVLVVSALCTFKNAEGAATFNLGQVYRAVDNTLKCLEKTPNLGMNATYQVVFGLGELYTIFLTVPRLKDSDDLLIKGIIARENAFVQRGLAAFPNMMDVQLLWHPQYWALTGDYRFRKIFPNQSPVDQTLSQIYERSIGSQQSLECYNDLIADNGGSPTLRQCVSSCEDIMSSQDLQSGISPDERLTYLGTEILLNCTNNGIGGLYNKVQYICQYLLNVVDTMYEHRNDDQFADIYFYFLSKVQFCGSFGFTEFYSQKIIPLIIGRIGCNGCVGRDQDSLETKQILTAQTLGILGSTIRYLLEESSPQIHPFLPGLVGKLPPNYPAMEQLAIARPSPL